MNHQQARIWALLEDAAAEFEADEVVSLTTETALAEEGYVLRRLPDDIENILANR